MLLQTQENQRKILIHRMIRDGQPFSLRRAVDIIDEWAQKDPGSGYPAMYQGILAVLKHDFNAALFHFNKAIEKNPSEAIFWKNKAVSLIRLSRHQDALESIQRAYLLSATMAEELSCLQMIGELLTEMGLLLESERIFRKIVQMGYRSDGLFITLWLQGRYREALEALLAFVDLSAHLDDHTFSNPPPESGRSLFNELLEYLSEFLQEGYSPDLILQALDLPHQDVKSNHQEHINWWRKLIEDETWLRDMQETLYILSVPGWKERILAAREEPAEDRVSLAELVW